MTFCDWNYACRQGCTTKIVPLWRIRIFLFIISTVHDVYTHSAWSESSAACPRPRGGRRGGEKLAPGTFATLQRRGPQGRAHIWRVFSCKNAKRDEWRGPKGRADEPVFVDVWSKTPNLSHRRLTIGCFQGNQYVTLSSSVLFRNISLQQTVLPPSRALMRSAIALKPLKMTDFSRTGSRNMAETCAINFLTSVSYSTSIVIGGLRRLLLPVLMWAGVDLENFRPGTAWCSFGVFFPRLITHGVS